MRTLAVHFLSLLVLGGLLGGCNRVLLEDGEDNDDTAEDTGDTAESSFATETTSQSGTVMGPEAAPETSATPARRE